MAEKIVDWSKIDIRCPRCGVAGKVVKHGKLIEKGGNELQKFKCKACAHIFHEGKIEVAPAPEVMPEFDINDYPPETQEKIKIVLRVLAVEGHGRGVLRKMLTGVLPYPRAVGEQKAFPKGLGDHLLKKILDLWAAGYFSKDNQEKKAVPTQDCTCSVCGATFKVILVCPDCRAKGGRNYG